VITGRASIRSAYASRSKIGADFRVGPSDGDVGFKSKVGDNLPDMEHLGLPCIAVKRGKYMHPAFWPMQAFVFWADVLMLPWKMMMALGADSLNVAASATSPAATAGLDPVSPKESVLPRLICGRTPTRNS